jgi:signal transduction histidine kinase
VCTVFGFARGAVFAEREGDLAVLASLGAHELDIVPRGADRSMETAWAEGRPVLLRRVDPDGDRRIASMFPGGRNLIVVPIPGARSSLGSLVVERAARGAAIRRSVLAMVEEFSGHAWLALNNVWLLDDIRTALEENRALQEQLAKQNGELEATVENRTAEVTQRLGELRMVDDARRALIEKLVSAQEEERSRLAGDIHDDPVQKMVATSMRLQLLRRQVSDPEITKLLEQLLSTVKTSIASLRHLIFELRPSVLDADGLSTALRQLLEKMREDSGDDRDVEYELRDQLASEPPGEIRTMLYRIVQEALGNVRKHARAEHVTVLLGERDGGYFAQVTDDGVGFGAREISASAPGHLGLTSMRERAELTGGWCRVQSLPGNGTSVEVWLPDPESMLGNRSIPHEPGLPVPTRALPEPARR